MNRDTEDPSQRLQNFKNKSKSDEMRRRRTEVTVQLRKSRKDDQLQKRRNISIDTEVGSSTSTDEQIPTPLHDISSILAGLQSDDAKVQFFAVQSARKMLSQEQNPPIDKMIKSGVVSQLVQFLDDYDSSVDIQFEAAWALTNIASGTSEQTLAVIQSGAIPCLVKLLLSPHQHVVEQSVWALGNIAGDGPGPRDLILNLNVMNTLISLITLDLPVQFLRNIVWTISNLCRNKNPPPPFNLVEPCLPYVTKLLEFTDIDVIADCCWTLSYLTDGTNDKIQRIIDQGVVPRLIGLLQKGVSSITTPALRVIGNIVTGNDEQTDVVLAADGLVYLCTLLQSERNNLIKESAWAISNITAGTPNQIQQVIDAGVLPPLIHVLQTGDHKSQREAAWAVTNFTSGCTANQLAELLKAGVIPPICGILANRDWKTISVALDGILNILTAAEKVGEHVLIATAIEECGGVDKLELLQNHENEQIYHKAIHIIDGFFSDGEEAAAEQNVFGCNGPDGPFSF